MIRKKGQVQKGRSTRTSGRKGRTQSKRHRPEMPGLGAEQTKEGLGLLSHNPKGSGVCRY